MNQTQKRTPIIIGLLILAMLTLQACSITSASAETALSSSEQSLETVDDNNQASAQEDITPAKDAGNASTKPEDIVHDSSDLTDEEIDSLIYMREEEKLAHDVYLAMYDLWGLSIFKNIANSEQTHTDAVKGLLDTYDIPDPVDTSPAGVFQNADLQSLYDQLTELGAQSLGEALKVGAAIEEIDILDLLEALEFVENSAVRRVYENLLKGSENHLRAFTSTLEKQTGESYTPQYLSEDAFDEIVSAQFDRGTREGDSQDNRPQENESRGKGRRDSQNQP